MVWGMSLPSGFGEFFPMGNFEAHIDFEADDWYNRLNGHYERQTLEEQRRLFDYDKGDGPTYGSYVADKFISERGTVSVPMTPPLSSIESHEPPRSFVTEKGYKSLGSLIMLNGRILAVDEALKAIIERLEPSVHEFFPIEIRMPRNKVYPSPYYTLFIGQYFDSFLPKESERQSFRKVGSNPDHYSHEDTKKGFEGLAFSQDAFGNAHLWRERRLGEWLTCFSDELQAEITKADLRMPKKIYPMREV